MFVMKRRVNSMLDEFWQNAVGLFGLFRAPFLCPCSGCTDLHNLQEAVQVELKGLLQFCLLGIWSVSSWCGMMPGGCYLCPPQTGSFLVLHVFLIPSEDCGLCTLLNPQEDCVHIQLGGETWEEKISPWQRFPCGYGSTEKAWMDLVVHG